MISFACQNIDLQDIITCSFELNKTEYELLLFLLQQQQSLTVHDIAKKRGLERSTVQKAISQLLQKALVERRQMNLSSGGYRFLYGVHDKDDMKQRLMSIVDGWHENVTKVIKHW
ncbi:MarR family transcriptional regulator [Candidatus Woesearchaeota archaeon]|nr:MarR family transcriptional regulator [Candidatus Woesearchaeota archaeon]